MQELHTLGGFCDCRFLGVHRKPDLGRLTLDSLTNVLQPLFRWSSSHGVVHVPLVGPDAQIILDGMVNPIRDNQRHGLRFLAAQRQTNAFMLAQLLRFCRPFRFIGNFMQLVFLIHPGDLHAKALKHPVKPDFSESFQAIAVPEVVKELCEVAGHDKKAVAIFRGQLFQEHCQPVPGICDALSLNAGRVISNQGALCQRHKTAVTIAALHNAAVNHDRMDLAQLAALM